MQVRDAVEADAEVLAAIAEAPAGVMENLIHERSIRIAERFTENGPNVDAESVDAEVLGFVSFDVQRQTVHVTQIAGSAEACERLLAEPVRFAAREGMPVELVVPSGESTVRSAAEAVGFEERGAGPTFDGTRTVRYRLRPE